MVMFIVSAQQADTDAVFQPQVAGYLVGVAVADACSGEEFALVAVAIPLPVVRRRYLSSNRKSQLQRPIFS